MIQKACKPAAVAIGSKYEPASVSAGLPSGSSGPGSLGSLASVRVKPRQQSSANFLSNDEPLLDEMMADEVVLRMMNRDGVVADQLLSMLDRVRANLA